MNLSGSVDSDGWYRTAVNFNSVLFCAFFTRSPFEKNGRAPLPLYSSLSPSEFPTMFKKGRSRLVNSIGKMNFVDSLAPSCFRVSKYWRLSVFPPTLCATALILSRAMLKPSARRTAACWSPSAFSISAWRSPSALRISDCFWPSATVISAWRVPSASVTAARLTRSQTSAVHGFLYVPRGFDLSNLNLSDFNSPPLGNFVQLHPQRLVNSLTLREDIVQAQVPNDRAQRGRRLCRLRLHGSSPLRGQTSGRTAL